MNLQEAYAAIDAVARSNQAVLIRVETNWYDRFEGARSLSVDFQVSLVPGFNSVCDQFISKVSLQSAVNQCLAAAAEFAAAPATVEIGAALVAEAAELASLVEDAPVSAEIAEDDIPW